MKKVLFFLVLAFILTGGVFAQENGGFGIGIHVLGGGRYDNVRMCVGSPPGVPGGPIGEVYLDLRFPMGENGRLIVNLPIMRPILFAVSFKMLQLEPQITYEYTFGSGDGLRPVIAGGLGAVFHYGPDYTSNPESPGPSFFSVGPLVTGSAGVKFWKERIITGLKLFYAPLFTADRPIGTILGGGVEAQLLIGG